MNVCCFKNLLGVEAGVCVEERGGEGGSSEKMLNKQDWCSQPPVGDCISTTAVGS